MESLEVLYEQYNSLLIDLQDNNSSDLTTDLLQYGINRDYFDKVNNAILLLQKFRDHYLLNKEIRSAVSARLKNDRTYNVEFCLLIDVLRCYDGLDHPTTFNTPEGIALMVLLERILRQSKIERFEQLNSVSPATLKLIDIIPFLVECSYEIGNRNTLFLSSIFEKYNPEIDRTYRRLLYKLCKQIAEVDGEISVSEDDWLKEVALLNDDHLENDIDVVGL